jgi:hypothetical protein
MELSVVAFPGFLSGVGLSTRQLVMVPAPADLDF